MWHLCVISKEQGVGVVVQSQRVNDLLYQDFSWFKKTRSEFTQLLMQHVDDSCKSVFTINFNPDNSIEKFYFDTSDLISIKRLGDWFYLFDVDSQEMTYYKGFCQCDKRFRALNPEDEYNGIF
jgi:hypothetical protein